MEDIKNGFAQMKASNDKLDSCNDHRTCEILTLNKTAEIYVTLTFLSVAYIDCNLTYADRIRRDISMPCAGNAEMLLHTCICWKFIMAKSKSSRLSYN
jgi:hypothetical protein